jgi:hypothetical protein
MNRADPRPGAVFREDAIIAAAGGVTLDAEGSFVTGRISAERQYCSASAESPGARKYRRLVRGSPRRRDDCDGVGSPWFWLRRPGAATLEVQEHVDKLRN